MIDYDVRVAFTDGAEEVIKIQALSRVRALITATYSLEKWDFEKQDQVRSLEVHLPRMGRPG